MPHVFSIAVVSKVEGDFETEDEMMDKIQEFSVSLLDEYREKAHLLVHKEYGIDPNEFGDLSKQEQKRTVSAGGNVKKIEE